MGRPGVDGDIVALAQDDSAACETTSPQLPVPNFRLRMHNIAGLRPHQKECYRLEAEEVDDKFFVHNPRRSSEAAEYCHRIKSGNSGESERLCIPY